VLHVAQGDCVKVDFTNHRGTTATLHVDELQHKVSSSGINIGNNPLQAVPAGGQRTYWFFADTEKIGSAVVSDYGSSGANGTPELSGVLGLYGAFVVSPKGATFTDAQGNPTDTGPIVDVHVDGQPQLSTRDATLFFSDTEKQLGADFMPYPRGPSSPSDINYRNAGDRGDDANTFSSIVHGDPPLVVKTLEGDPLTVHVIGAPGNDQTHLFNMGGLSFEWDHWLRDAENRNLSLNLNTRGFGGFETFDADVRTGVHDAVADVQDDPFVMTDDGGTPQAAATGDYFVGDMRRPFTEQGMWGLIRIMPQDCAQACPQHL